MNWLESAPHVLREYAMLADGERGALCGPRGEIAWMCVPRWDSDAVFAAMIGGAGLFSVTPAAQHVWGGSYQPGTLIWCNRWVTTAEIVQCRDALAFPGEPHRAVILRRIDAVEHDARLRVQLDARAGFGRHPLHVRRDQTGSWTGRTGELTLRLSGAAQATVDDRGRLVLDLRVPAGGQHDLVLEISDRELPDPPDADRLWADTEQRWLHAVPTFDDSVAPRDARHAYAVMRGLTSGGGGMVAAASMSLPERAEAGRNYDYRYVWLRDQCYAGIAAGVRDPLPLLDAAVSFVTARVLADGDRLAPASRVDGRALPGERTLDLPGYPGGNDVVGNRVTGQFQLDALGEILQLLTVAARHDRLGADERRAADLVARLIAERWQLPDAGIWELHDDWWTHSRLACVAGLRVASAPLKRPQWIELADAMLAETARRCLRRDGGWQRSPRTGATGAALVLPPVRGALPADDPRTMATLAAVGRELTEDGYVYRFDHGDRALGDAEGAFLLCGFMMSLAAWHQGDRVEAFRWFERNRAGCGPPGLLAEEFDVQQRQLRGNLPQAFVHALLLETAQRLHDPVGW